jgi:putative hydrolase
MERSMIQPNTTTAPGHILPPSNEELAERLETVSKLLAAQGANRFRADAYHRAAETLLNLEQPACDIYFDEGIHGLESLTGVGRTISRALQQMIRGGRWPLLERLQGGDVVEQAFMSVPNIGPKLAARIHNELGIETLAELQAAAWDGRLRRMGGFGEKRIRAVRESLAARGRYTNPLRTSGSQIHMIENEIDLTAEISVAELLDVDDEYRYKAAHGELPRIAPRRFNPTAKTWLPVLHTERNEMHYTALFSNTEHAHSMGTTRDWVVIYLEDHKHQGQHGRWTVITSKFGKLRGKRIVRGREKECAEFCMQRSS